MKKEVTTRVDGDPPGDAAPGDAAGFLHASKPMVVKHLSKRQYEYILQNMRFATELWREAMVLEDGYCKKVKTAKTPKTLEASVEPETTAEIPGASKTAKPKAELEVKGEVKGEVKVERLFKYLSYTELNRKLKGSFYYAMLPAQTAQQILKSVEEEMKSCIAVAKSRNDTFFHLPRLEGPPDGLTTLSYPFQNLTPRCNRIKLPVSNAYKRVYRAMMVMEQQPRGREERLKTMQELYGQLCANKLGKPEGAERAERKVEVPTLEISLPKSIMYSGDQPAMKICELQLVPHYNGRYITAIYSYQLPNPVPKRDYPDIMGIDLGVDVLAALVDTADTVGAPILVDGRYLSMINNRFIRRMGYLQSIRDRYPKGCGDPDRLTNQMVRIYINRDHRMDNYIKQAANYIIDTCLDKGIGTICVGWNPEIKQKMDMGKENNRKFALIAHRKLRSQLKFLCLRNGITYQEIEESYTSKSSFLDGDPLPVYNRRKECPEKFSGKRVHRGQYKTGPGLYVHADINGAANIIRKYCPDLSQSAPELYARLCKAVMTTPERVRMVPPPVKAMNGKKDKDHIHTASSLYEMIKTTFAQYGGEPDGKQEGLEALKEQFSKLSV